MIEKICARLEALTHDNPMVTNNYILRKDAMKIVQEVSKEYGNGWIPVEVAMPTEEGWYRVTCEDKNIFKKPMLRDLYYYPTLESFIDNIRYAEHGCKDIKSYDWTMYVTAWKPLEEPYRK